MTSKYHFIGIGGIGMSGLARLLLQRQISVSGSDLVESMTLESLRAAGAETYVGHNAKNVSAGSTVIYTTGIKEDNAEYHAAKMLGCTLMHRSDLLAELTSAHSTIAIAGMHGKTTTSALLVSVLIEAGKDPSFAVGGILGGLEINAHQGSGHHFVIEACESDGTFLKYRPAAAIVTNIDIEHMDFFGSEGALEKAFIDFIALVSDPKLFFFCGDDPWLMKIAPKGYSYGFSPNCAWRILNFRNEGWQVVFDLVFEGESYCDITLAALGKHNALNGAAVFALALCLGIAENSIRKAFKSFRGIARRCEMKGEYANIMCIDDYAHHPVEIQTTLQGVREAIGNRRLVVVYQPHRFTRARDCLGMYNAVFDAADEVIITDIYAASEAPIDGINNESIVADIQRSSSVSVIYVPHQRLIETLEASIQAKDIILTLGAGNITLLGPQLLKHLELNQPLLSCHKDNDY